MNHVEGPVLDDVDSDDDDMPALNGATTMNHALPPCVYAIDRICANAENRLKTTSATAAECLEQLTCELAEHVEPDCVGYWQELCQRAGDEEMEEARKKEVVLSRWAGMAAGLLANHAWDGCPFTWDELLSNDGAGAKETTMAFLNICDLHRMRRTNQVMQDAATSVLTALPRPVFIEKFPQSGRVTSINWATRAPVRHSSMLNLPADGDVSTARYDAGCMIQPGNTIFMNGCALIRRDDEDGGDGEETDDDGNVLLWKGYDTKR